MEQGPRSETSWRTCCLFEDKLHVVKYNYHFRLTSPIRTKNLACNFAIALLAPFSTLYRHGSKCLSLSYKKMYTNRSCSKCSLNRRAAALCVHAIAADKLNLLVFLNDLIIELFVPPVDVEAGKLSTGALLDTMASMIAHPLALTSTTAARTGDAVMTEKHESPSQRKKKGEVEDRPRGRRRSRPQNKASETNGNTSEGGDNGTADDGHSSGPDGPSRKRRRSRKGLDKKFECTQEGCTKSYSRAEHLYVTYYYCIPLERARDDS